MICLVVDDSQLVRKVARYMMESLALTCYEAEDGDDALIACREHKPDVILLDWNMPRMSGVEFAERMHVIHHGHKPKIIFCTTESFVPHIERLIQLGMAHGYIMKPFDEEIIAAKLRELGLRA